MEALPIPPDGDQSRAPALLALFWAPFPFTVMLVSARLYVRMAMKNVGRDDYFMFAAWVLYVIATSLSTVDVVHGGARHLFYLKPAKVVTVLKYNWLSQPFGVMASAFGKSSVAFLTLRLLGPNARWQKLFLYINVGLYILVSILSCVILFVQCSPARALWEIVPGAKCWNPKINANFSVFQSAYGTFLDFVLALIPVTFIWTLKLSLKKKLGLCVLLGLGVFAGICAAIKTSQLPDVATRVDFTWATFSVFAWASAEISLVIICGCVPAVKPLYDWFVSGKRLGLGDSRYPSKRSYQVSTDHSSSCKTTLNQTGNSTNATTTAENDQPSNYDNNSNASLKMKKINVQQCFDVHFQDRAMAPRNTSDQSMV